MNNAYIFLTSNVSFVAAHFWEVIFSIFSIYILTQIVFLLWLWLKHDWPLKKLHAQLLETPQKVQEQFKGRGATHAGVQSHVNAEEMSLRVEIEKREYKRKLFLDRVNLFSILKIK